MEPRQQRGILIAMTQPIMPSASGWLVPSQSGTGKYTVRVINKEEPSCTCPDHENGFKCKHIFAVEFMFTRITQEQNADGSTTTTTETLTVKTTAERKTYKQDWPKYDAAMANERRHFHEILADLCATAPEPQKDRSKGGRPSIPLRDGLFAACLKVYSLMSARRFNGELEDAHAKGFIGCLPHINYALDVPDKKEVTPILKELIRTSRVAARRLGVQDSH